MKSRTWSLAAAGLLLLGADPIATDYKAARTVSVETEFAMEMETTRMEVDGQERTGGGSSQSTSRAMSWSDKVLEHKDGRPTKLRRAFGDINLKASMVFGDRDSSSEREGTLANVVLELTDDGDKVEAKVVEGSADGAVLEGHRLTLSLDAFLPEKKVDEGDTWEIEGSALKHVLALDLQPKLFPPEEPPSGGSGGEGRRGPRGPGSGGLSLLINAEWEGKATLGANEEHDGAQCRVIKLEFTADGEIEETSFGGGRGRAFGVANANLVETTYELKLEGKLYFDTAKNMPVHLELEGNAKIDSERSFERDGTIMKFSSTQEGDVKYEVTLSAE